MDRVLRGDNDTMAILLRLSQEFSDIKLLMVSPRDLMVQIDDEMSKYARQLLKTVSWEEGGGLQLVGYNTQFRVIFVFPSCFIC